MISLKINNGLNGEVNIPGDKSISHRSIIISSIANGVCEVTNILKSEQIAMKVKLDIIEKLPEIIKQSVKPIENIDGIKIVDVGGLGLNSEANGSSGSKNSDDIVDRVVTGAMKYKTQAPILEQLVKEVGLVGEGENFNDLISGRSSLITGKQKKDDKPSPTKPKTKKE